MHSEIMVFRKLFLWLWDSSRKPWEFNGIAKHIYELTPVRNAQIGTAEELEGLLPRENKVIADMSNRFFYLEPPQRGLTFVPVLSMICDFGRNIPKVRLRTALFFIDEHDQLQAIGIRYESPEGTGNHHYYHAQFITGFQKDGSFADARSHEGNYALQDFWLEKSIPTKQPAFPLDADGPVKLLLCLLISLYGLSFLSKLLNESDLGSELKKHYFPGVKFCQFNPIVWYWKVTSRDPMKTGYTVYETQKDPGEFKEEVRKKYPRHTIVGITKEEYDGEPERRRKTC